MDAIKPNPFIAEVEGLLTSLGLDVGKSKQVVPNGILLYFNFNEIPIYVCLPSLAMSNYSNIARIEAVVADLHEIDASQLVVGIASYLHIHDCTVVRVASKRSAGQSIKVLIELVCNLHLLQIGALAELLLHCCELADHLRNEMVLRRQSETT